MTSQEPSGFKVCTNCKEEKLLTDFSKWHNACKKCANLSGLKYYKANLEKYAESARKYREKHGPDLREGQRKYRIENPDRVAASRKKYSENNAEKINARSKRYHESHREEREIYRKQYFQGTWQGVKAKLKSSARKRNKHFDLSDETVQRLFAVTCCEHPACGKVLNRASSSKNSTRDDTASVDRIDNALGYIEGNVWVLCRRCNVRKSDATLEWLETLVSEMKRRTISGV